MSGKQKRIKRPPTVDGMLVEEFLRRNTEPIWLHQNEMWEYVTENNEEKFDDIPIDDDSIPFKKWIKSPSSGTPLTRRS
jgi:hypothetical protein